MRCPPWTPRGAASSQAHASLADGALAGPIPTEHPPREQLEGALPIRAPADLLPLVVGLAWASGFIHAFVIPDHFGESALHTSFFVVVASLQLIWGARAYRDPGRRVLLAGAIGSCVIAAIWLISRTIGAPTGLDAWETEAFGALDVLATVNELALAGLVALILRGRLRLTTHRMLLTSTVVGVLVMASLLAPMLTSHSHGG